jgi:PDZ domain
MSGPRHLWSGDWRTESERARQRLAEDRAEVGDPDPPTLPAVAPPPSPPRESWLSRARTSLRSWTDAMRTRRRRLRSPLSRRAIAVMLIAAVVVGGVVVAANALDGGGTASVQSGEPWLGVEMSAQLTAAGALVQSVVPASPAEHAGLQPGDLIMAVNGQPVLDPSDVATVIASERPGQQVQLQVQRGFQELTLVATLRTRPAGSP